MRRIGSIVELSSALGLEELSTSRVADETNASRSSAGDPFASKSAAENRRSRLANKLARAWILVASITPLAGCPNEESGGGGADTDGETEGEEMCDPDGTPPPAAGVWNATPEDWSDVGAPGFQGDALMGMCGDGQVTAHHCFLTSVHTSHLHTGELLMFHGQHDERVWEIGAPASEMTWHPVGPETTWQRRYNDGDTVDGQVLDCPGGASWCFVDRTGFPDLFCVGATQLADGSVLMGGGNVTGNASGGGLQDLFRFQPVNAQGDPAESAFENGCGFGWSVETAPGGYTNPLPQMTYDRWYPSLVTLGDGRVLIAGGTSRGFADANGNAQQPTILEVYNPTAATIGITGPNEIEPITDAPFLDDEGVPTGVPNYPFLFVLPSGDIFYAGAEGAVTAGGDLDDGRILVPETNSGTGLWRWDEHVVASLIPGGSAVMYEPGKILKTGGSGNPQAAAEWVDLSGFGPDDYAGAPTAFEHADDPTTEPNAPQFARHYHNLVLLADGRVAAIGGNSSGNWDGGDHHNNPCTIGSTPVQDFDCIADGCPSLCIDTTPDIDPSCTGNPHTPTWNCSLLQGVVCACPATLSETDCLERPNCAWTGTCGTVMPEDDFCDAVMAGATCEASGRCSKACADAQGGPDDSQCTNLEPVGGACVAPTIDETNDCSPQNNECFATKAAEIWDPSCGGEWTTLGEEEHERMYHSVALLMPDGSVMSAGGGHSDFSWVALEEQRTAQYFEPEYTDVVAPAVAQVTNAPTTMPYGSEVEIVLEEDVEITRATLVRLAATTHGFDSSQRFLELGVTGAGSSWTVFAPADQDEEPLHLAQNIAPPGYYMLFLFSEDGQPSEANYIKVGPNTVGEFTCELAPTFSANEVSCTAQPVGGECPPGGTVTTAAPLPVVDGPMGTVNGVPVFVAIDVVHDPVNPRPDELAAVKERCSDACEAHFDGMPGVIENCALQTSFLTPVPFATAEPALDLIPQVKRHGEGIFPGQQLSCDLGADCWQGFDELVARSVAQRVSPAHAMLFQGEEYRVALGKGSKIEIITNRGTWNAAITGSVGYSGCRDGHATTPCPFYLGSFEAVAASPVTPTMTCDDGTTGRPTIDDIVVGLTQPAFGIAKQGTSTTQKGFPTGALVAEVSFDVGREHYATRRPNRLPVIVSADNGAFSASNLMVTMEVPCNTSTATVSARLTIVNPSTPPLERPPTATITTPSMVNCSAPVALAATVTDPDGDLHDVRWKVDGVLINRTTTSLVFTGPHQIEVIARDVRGAATTARKQIQCN
jgi:hypothetical protein